MRADFALVDQTLFGFVHEFDRVFDGEDVRVFVFVDVEVQKKLDRMETIQEKAAALQKQLDALKENKIKPADIDLEQKTKSDVKSESVEVKQKICQLQYNFYFDQAEFNVDKPYLLVIKDAYCGGREFAVDPALLK